MRESITKNQFLVTILLNVLNTILVSIFSVLIYSDLSRHKEFRKEDLIFFSVFSFSLIINSIYLFINLICDFSLYVNKSKYLEKLNNCNRNFYCHYCNPFSYFCMFPIPYIYIFVTAFVVTDIIVHEHNKIKFDLKIGIWLFIISSLSLYLLKIYNFEMVGFFSIWLIYIFLFLCYLFQIYLVNKFAKNKNINISDTNLNEETKKENDITSTLIQN